MFGKVSPAAHYYIGLFHSLVRHCSHSIGHDDSMLAFPSCVLIPIGAFEGAAPDFRVPLESISKATSFVSFVAVR
jgi:hypothetical protein